MYSAVHPRLGQVLVVKTDRVAQLSLIQAPSGHKMWVPTKELHSWQRACPSCGG